MLAATVNVNTQPRMLTLTVSDVAATLVPVSDSDVGCSPSPLSPRTCEECTRLLIPRGLGPLPTARSLAAVSAALSWGGVADRVSPSESLDAGYQAVARGIGFCRTFLHVARVRKHTAMRELHAKRAKNCDTNHIPRATAYRIPAVLPAVTKPVCVHVCVTVASASGRAVSRAALAVSSLGA